MKYRFWLPLKFRILSYVARIFKVSIITEEQTRIKPTHTEGALC